MKAFHRRKDDFEKQFARDEALKFKATARRNKLLGLWAAEKLGLDDAHARAYAKALVLAEIEQTGDGDVFDRLRADFDSKGVAVPDDDIRSAIHDLMDKAVAEVKASG